MPAVPSFFKAAGEGAWRGTTLTSSACQPVRCAPQLNLAPVPAFLPLSTGTFWMGKKHLTNFREKQNIGPISPIFTTGETSHHNI